MKPRDMFLLAALGLSACDAGAAPTIGQTQSAVVNGTIELDDEGVPVVWFQYEVLDDKVEGCSAIPLEPNILLTTAHCVTDDEGNLRAFLMPGLALDYTHDGQIDDSTRFEQSTILATFVHPAYVAELKQRRDRGADPVQFRRPDVPDVAAILLAKPLPAAWPKAIIDTNRVLPGEKVTFAGYGCFAGNLPAQEEAELARLYRRLGETNVVAAVHINDIPTYFEPIDPVQLDRNYFVTEGPAINKDVAGLCHGDSGGPVFRGDPKGRLLVGINSAMVFRFGDYSGKTSYDARTRIESLDVFNWIQSVTAWPSASPPDAPTNVEVRPSGSAAEVFWDLMPPSASLQFVVTPDGAPHGVINGSTRFLDTFTPLEEGRSYVYRVCFSNGGTPSCTSVSYTHHFGATQRSPVPVPVNVRVTPTQPGEVEVAWQLGIPEVFAPQSGWMVESRQWSPAIDPDWRWFVIADPTARSARLTVDPTRHYDFRVCAIDDAGAPRCSEAPHFDLDPRPRGRLRMVADPSFEMQVAGVASTRWPSTGATPARAVQGAAVAHSGERAMALVVDGRLAGIEQEIAVAPDAPYSLSLWLRGNTPAYVGVRGQGRWLAARQVFLYPESWITPADPQPPIWHRAILRFSAPAGATSVKVFVQATGAELPPGAELLVDDVTVRPADECVPLTCESSGACGTVSDGCSGWIQCADCPAPASAPLPPAGSEMCDGIGEASFEPLLAILAEARAQAQAAGAASVIASIDRVNAALVQGSAWLHDNQLDATNPSAASSTEWMLNDQNAILLTAAQDAASLAPAALAALERATLLADALAAQAGRCFFDKYATPDSWWDWTLGRQPELGASPAPPVPATCGALDAHALAPLLDWLAYVVDNESAALAMFAAQPQAQYAQWDHDYAVEALGRVHDLALALGDAGSAADPTLAAQLQDTLRLVANGALIGALYASYIGTDLPGPSRRAFENDLAVAHHAMQLGARAGRCVSGTP